MTACRTLVHVNMVIIDDLQSRINLFYFNIFFTLKHTGAPVYISNPHFYQSDPKFIAEVEGLNPQKELHETYFKIQPVIRFSNS